MRTSNTHSSALLNAVDSPRLRQIVGVVAFAVLTALSARISLPIPGTAVPFSFQPLAVMLAGALLGARLGALSQTVYLVAGIAGLPVFALGSILAPSGGYLMAYPLAAFMVGLVMNGRWLRDSAGLLTGLGVIYLGGFAWLSLTVGPSVAFLTGIVPFVVPDLVKVALALVVSRRLMKPSRSTFAA